MSQLKLTADSGGGTVAIKAPASTTGNAALDLTVPGTASATLDTLGRAGNILQVVQTVKTDTASNSTASGGVWTPTTPKCSITPSNASNKILVQATIAVALSTDAHGVYLTVLKDGSPIFRGDQEGSNMQRTTVGTFSHNQYKFGHLVFNYLDTAGGTSAIEYSLDLRHDSGSTSTIYLNRTEASDDVDDRKRGASSIILMEVAA